MSTGAILNAQPARKASYRPEIDGLRALAVVAVLVNHLNEHALPGGYLGVDIFFVISGYVVTSSLLARKDAGWRDFLTRFYQRRFRRLLPALITNILIVSIIFAAFASPLDDVRVPSIRTGIASLVGVSNLYLLKQGTDYFAASTQFNPFTHTWSLGVEEQYYLVWPIILLICGVGLIGARHSLRKLTWMSIALFVISLAAYLHLSFSGQAQAAFFLMPARFWELSMGCLAFIFHSRILGKRKLPSNRAMDAAGIALIIFVLAVLFAPDELRVAATLAIVALTAFLLVLLDDRCRLGRLLSHPLSLTLGVMSYSIYLWHWPVIVLARWTWGVTWLTLLPILALITVFSWLSYRLEVYFRYHRFGTSIFSHPLLVYPLAALFTGIIALLLQGSWKWLIFLGDRSQQLVDSNNMKRIPGTGINTVNCFREPPARIDQGNVFNQCLVRKSDDLPTLFFEGDSHTNAIIPIGEKLLQDGRFNVAFFSRGGCPFPYFSPWADERHDSNRYRNCKPHYQAQWQRLKPLIKPGDSLVLVSSFAGYFPYKDQKKLTMAESSYKKEIDFLANSLKSRAARLIIFAPLPVFRERPDITFPYTICRTEWFRPAWTIARECKPVHTSRKAHLKSVSRYEALLSQISSQHSNVAIFSPLDTICPQSLDQCSTHEDSNMIFFDSNHLANYGALALYPSFIRFLDAMNDRPKAS